MRLRCSCFFFVFVQLVQGQFNFEQSPSNGFDHSNRRKWTGAPIDADREVGGSIADNEWAVGGPQGSKKKPPLSRFVLQSAPASQDNEWAGEESRSIGQGPPFANSRPVVVPSAPLLQGVLGNGQSQQQASNHLHFPTSFSDHDRPAHPHPSHPQARQGPMPMPRLPSFPSGQQPPVIIIPNNGNMRTQGPVASTFTFTGPSIPNPNLPRVVPSIPLRPTPAPAPIVPSPMINPPLQGVHGAHIPFQPISPNEQENRLVLPSSPNVIPSPHVRIVPSPHPTLRPHPTHVVPNPAAIEITKPHPQEAIQLPPPPQRPERPRQVVEPRPMPPPEPLPQPKPQPSQPSPGLKTASEKIKSSHSTNYCDRAEFSDHDLADLSLERVEYFISNSSCSQHFFQCSIGQTFMLSCPSPKQAFDRSTVNCNFRYNIKTCPEYDHVIHCTVRDTCTAGEFACCGDSPQKCVGLDRRCDGVNDCGDGEDENNCPSCAPDEFPCVKSGRCIAASKRCNGQPDDCADESNMDELNCGSCAGKFHCSHVNTAAMFGARATEICVDWMQRCDGVKDCPSGEDEINCKSRTAKYLMCEDQKQSVERSQWCNSVVDCRDGSDEAYCYNHLS